MSLILRLLTGSFGSWILIGYTFASFSAGGYVVHKWHQANRASVERLAAEKRDNENRNAHETRIEIDRMPDGAASRRLFLEWGRDEGR